MISAHDKIRVRLAERSYDIIVSPGLFSPDNRSALADRLREMLDGRSVLAVADSNTATLCARPVLDTLALAGVRRTDLHVFPAGEPSKTFQTAEQICRAAVRAGLDRSSFFVGIGGGVAGDMTAFAASIYMRGVACVQVPTSLLAMIDSGVGGKTGVDLPEGKNLIGTFYQPKMVLMDPVFLKTLPREQISCGCAELVKHAILFDPDLFDLLAARAQSLLDLSDLPLFARLVGKSCALKADVVSADEHESGQRMLLNLGHTFGHAVEKLQNFAGFNHGQAVSFGIACAASLSVRIGHLGQAEADRIDAILRLCGLPVSVSALDPRAILNAMRADKKNLAGQIRLILPVRIGRADIFPDIPESDILAALETRCD